MGCSSRTMDFLCNKCCYKLFSRYSTPISWLVHGHMASNNETVSRQMPRAGNSAKLWRQRETVHCYPRNVDRCCTWSEVARSCQWNLCSFFKIAFVLFCYITNHSMAGPLGNSEFCFPRISIRFSGNKIHCPPRDQSLNVNYLTLVERTEISIFFYLWSLRIASWFVNCLTDWLNKTLVETRGMITMKRRE